MINEPLQVVRPVPPVAGYIGGKRNLAERIIRRIEAVPHQLYAEPFVVMGGIFLRRSRVPKIEVINDRSRDAGPMIRLNEA